MKKFIKKTIAGLIAGVMAISSMPFTALAEEPTLLDQAKTALNNFTYTAPTGDYGSFKSDKSSDWNSASEKKGYDKYMRNVLYGQKSTEDEQGATSVNDIYTRIAYPQMVLLYDGKEGTNLDIPVCFSLQPTSGSKRYVYAAVSKTEELTFANNELWYGPDNGKQNYNWVWTYSNENAGGSVGNPSADITKEHTAYVSNGWQTGGRYTWRVWSNMFRFNGKFAADQYTMSINPQITVYSGSTSTPRFDDIVNESVATKPIYFINYDAVLDRIYKAKENINTYNYEDYTKESVDAYAQAVMGLVNLDYSFGFTSTTKSEDVADKVQLAGIAIRNAVNAYDKATLVKVIKLNEDEYTAALVDAKAKKSTEYTEASFKALTDEIVAVEEAKKTVTEQKDLDALTARLLTAVNNLNKKQLTVNLQVLPYGSETPEEKESKPINYGETYTSLEGAIGENQNVKKWVVETNNGQTFTTLNTFDKVVDVVITEDTTIKAYLSDDEVALTSTKVTFLGRHNKVVAIKYLAENQPLDTSDVEAPKVPFYDFVKWDVSKTNDGKEYTVKAVYTCNQDEKDKCTVHFFNGKEKTYTYNSYVYLFDAEKNKKYALYADADYKELLVVLDGVDFYTPQREHIYVKEYTGDAEANVAVMGSFATTEVTDGTTKYVANFNCKFNIPANAEAVDWGVILENSKGVQKPISIKEKSERNEYTVRIKVSKKVKVNACAYVTYKKADGTNVTKKSGFVTVDLNTL